MQDLGIVLIVILVLVLLWRGPKTLPKLGNALGRGVREARQEASQVQADIRARTSGDDDDTEPTAPAASAPVVSEPAATASEPAAAAPVASEPTDRPPDTA